MSDIYANSECAMWRGGKWFAVPCDPAVPIDTLEPIGAGDEFAGSPYMVDRQVWADWAPPYSECD